ncbi:MAG: GvpL/GvpF family gas vesicle protein [Rhodoferax sp.]|uniref:GvpL/GvpF family gas vesicle protein n=1 Tax=Rhodoferax sp. TaxID=50421 RepID=UPI002639F044|nr:GvpL/GvpF family gas vesicle protein [Rhodoferax sp.]MDD5332571.1 GvpL/GvpF family gas vesicle protein [Rhodoferax sp.]
MSIETRLEPGHYLYAIADAVESHPVYGNIGINGAPVYVISQGPLAAVVSDITEKRIRPERKNLAAHNVVIKRLMEETTVLPVAFGTIAASNKALLNILKQNGSTFVEQLDKVRGKVELGLRVVLDVPNIFEYMVTHHPDLAELRDAMLGKQHGPSQNDKIEMGRLFDHLLTQDREQHAETVMEVLGPRCVDVKQNPSREEKEVMHLACLVERGAQKAFEDGVFDAANRFDNNFSFDFNGPWAPHHFVSVALQA